MAWGARVTERTQVRFEHSPSRCPYCHDDCASDAEVVACRACVAKHHAECWEEMSRCGACGEARALREGGGAGPGRQGQGARDLEAAAVRTANRVGTALERAVLAAEPVATRVGLGLLFVLLGMIMAALTLVLAVIGTTVVIVEGAFQAIPLLLFLLAALGALSWYCFRRARVRLQGSPLAEFLRRIREQRDGAKPVPEAKGDPPPSHKGDAGAVT